MSRIRIVTLLGGVALSPALAQQYVISTYAGGGPPVPAPAPALDTSIGSTTGVATDAAGNVYFASADLHSVFKLDPSGLLTRVAGNGRRGYSGDGGPAASARLALGDVGFPVGLAVDNAGNLFITDRGNNRIRRVSPSGIITTVAGGGRESLGDGGPATSAQLGFATGMAVDEGDNLFIADLGNGRIRRISPSGTIATVAGNGASGFSGDGGLAITAALNGPTGVAVDGAGNLFITDALNHRIRKVSPDGIIITVAGNGGCCFSGDGGPATSAQLNLPVSIALDKAGNLFIADRDNPRIREVSTSGIITTVAGNGTFGFSGDGGPAASAQLSLPTGVAVDGVGSVLIADGNGSIRKVSSNGIITTVAGNGIRDRWSGDGGPATSAQLNFPWSIAVDSAGSLVIADWGDNRVRKVSASGTISTVADYSGGRAIGAGLSTFAVAADGAGNVLIADWFSHSIRKVSPDGIITTVAGNGTCGFSGDGGPATNAQMGRPTGVAVDGAGNLFIATSFHASTNIAGLEDSCLGGEQIRKVSPDGIITTVAGTGDQGFSGDGGPATDAHLMGPAGMAVDGAGNLFFADGNRIRKVSRAGIITTVAGGGISYPGDGGPATNAILDDTFSVAVDEAGNLFIADGNRIRKVSPAGIITTVAGNGSCCYSGDGGPATSAQLRFPTGIAVDGASNVYVAEPFNSVVRILRPTTYSLLIGAAVDAASQRADPVSPGKIVVIYGAGLGPTELIQNQPRNGVFGAELAGTRVSFNGIAAPLLYTSATQVAAIVPYAVIGSSAQMTVTYQGQVSNTFTVPMADSAPSIFTLNQTGAGQAAAINAVDGTVNTAVNPVKIGGYISLYATGEGQTTPPGVDGKLAGSPLAQPVLPVSVTVGGIPAKVQYKGGAPGHVAGLMQVNVQIPSGVQPGGYVPVVLQVGDRSSNPAVWIAVSGN